MRSLPGVRQPVVLGPTPAAPTVVGPASAGARLHAAVAPSTFVVNYDAGFNANPSAKGAFQAAVDEWSSVISSPVPITIDASFTSLPSGVLGSAGPTNFWVNFTGAPQANTWYPIALANARHGSDLDATIPDISATFSSTFSNFYFGTDGVPGAKVDFESVVLHEIGHGLGFVGLAGYHGSAWSCCAGSSYPGIYDRFTTGNGSPIATLSAGALPAAMQGADVRFTGAAATAANGGVAPKLYAPNPWQGGSSYSHLDEATYPAGNPNSLMTPAIGSNEVIHAPGPIALGIFADTGWTTNTTPLPKLSISSAQRRGGQQRHAPAPART